MFTLIALGLGAAYTYNALAMLLPDMIPDAFKTDGQVEVYFEAAAMIVALVLMGQVLELRARRRTGSAIRALLSLAPPTARVLRHGEETEVTLEEVHKGDLLKCSGRRLSSSAEPRQNDIARLRLEQWEVSLRNLNWQAA